MIKILRACVAAALLLATATPAPAADVKPVINDAGQLRPVHSGETVPLANGGTGATSASGARTNLGLGTFATESYATPPAIGGTTPAAGAFTTLGATGNLTTNVTGSTQCLQANSSGVVSGTGSACGVGGGTVRGLFDTLISSTAPTSTSTGFTTWRNQGAATVADVGNGVNLVDFANAGGGATNLRVRSKAVPATPYTATFLFVFNPAFAAATSEGVFVGWTNGTAYQILNWFMGATSASTALNVHNYTNASTFSAGATTASNGPTSNYLWLRLRDDGTTVTFSYSLDAINFIPHYSVAKASGFLGGSGYTNILWGIDARAARTSATLVDYTEAP